MIAWDSLTSAGREEPHLIVDPVVDGAGGGRPADGVGEALLDLAHALVAAGQHALVPLGVEQLCPRVQPHLAAQRAHLRRTALTLKSLTSMPVPPVQSACQ